MFDLGHIVITYSDEKDSEDHIAGCRDGPSTTNRIPVSEVLQDLSRTIRDAITKTGHNTNAYVSEGLDNSDVGLYDDNREVQVIRILLIHHN